MSRRKYGNQKIINVSNEDKQLAESAKAKAGSITALAVIFHAKASSASEWGRIRPIPKHLRPRLEEFVHGRPVERGYSIPGPRRGSVEAATALYGSPPPLGIDADAWAEILPLLPMLAVIFAAQDNPEHAERWGWIMGNIKTFYERISASAVAEDPQIKAAG